MSERKKDVTITQIQPLRRSCAASARRQRAGVQDERATIPRKVAMQMVGHRTESIYRRYHIVAEADIHAAGARLDSADGIRDARKGRR
jgi:hypothetical protein